MTINTSRRSTLKIMALAGSAAIVPGAVAAACKHGVNNDALAATSASTPIQGTGLIVSFSEKPGLNGSRQVIVTNTNDQPVTLSHVYPGIVSTPDGQYDLNSMFTNGAHEFAPKQATTLTIKTAQAHQLKSHAKPLRTADAYIQVRTNNANVNGGQPVTTMRNMFS